MIGRALMSSAEGIGNAVSNVVGTIWRNKHGKDIAIDDQQMAVFAHLAAEFAPRLRKTWWDSFVDGLNRLPRPVITFSIIGIFVWAFYDPFGFAQYMQAMEVVPDELWLMWLAIVAFWFGGRLVGHDLRKPQVTRAQLELAKEFSERRRERIETDTVASAKTVETPPETMAPLEISPQPVSAPAQRGASLSIESMIEALIAREGGYVNHPADRGGPTNHGITRQTLAAWRGRPVTTEEVKRLDRSEAAEIYRASYYFGPGIDSLPAAIQAHVLDIAVNSGPRTSIRLLQRALNRCGAGVKEDGVLGPATRAATAAYPGADINRELVGVRLRFYDDIVARDPRQRAFIDGWRKRANVFLTA
jgi:hypothetical protein